jgi:D-aminoacyl-tRNA deacylase
MKCLIQRVHQASVIVEKQCVGHIGPGLLVFLGCEKGDDVSKLPYHVKKLLNLRIFSDDAGKMNRSVQDVSGGILVVSQFTLAGDCTQGNRPGFENALPPKDAKHLYEQLIELLKASSSLNIQSGTFGAHMDVSLVNNGPVTFMLSN